MKPIDTLEQRSLFAFTRFFAIAAILLLLCGLVHVAIVYPTLTRDTSVSFAEVRSALKAEAAADESTNGTPATQLPTLPAPVKRHLQDSGEIQHLITSLGDLEPSVQRDILDNLASIIRQTEATTYDLDTVVYKYRQMKRERVSQKPFEKYEEWATKSGLLFVATAMVALVVLFTLVLVALAVERNTRMTAAFGATAAAAAVAKPNDTSASVT